MWPFSLKANKVTRYAYQEPKFCEHLNDTTHKRRLICVHQNTRQQEPKNAPQPLRWYELLSYLSPLEKTILLAQNLS